MTVPTTANRVQYNCDGETVEFAFNFPVYHKSNLIVVLLDTRTGVEETLVLDVDYEVSVPGGTVTLIGRFAYNPPDGNYKLTIIREIPLTQLIDLVNGDSMPADVLEEGYDRAVMLIQQLSERIGRSILLPVSSSVTGLTLPVPDPGKILKWNDGGDGFDNVNLADLSMQAVNAYWQDVLAASGVTLADVLTAMGLDPSLATLTLPDSVTISDFIKTLLDDTDAATARATLGVPDASEYAKGIAEIATQTEVDAGTDDARIVTPAKLYATPGIYRKNAIINGDMMVWQRGTSFAASADGAFHADRWSHIAATDAVVTVSRSTNVPTDAQGEGRFAASLQVDVTTADASIGSGQAHAITYKVEGYDIRSFVGQVCTLSFWVAATKPGIYCINLLCAGADRSYVKEYTINSANTWEKKTITFTLDASSGTWDFTNGVGLQIRWTLAAGSNYRVATDGVWGTALYATANQVNGLDSTDNSFLLTGVQLEKGSVATPFEFTSFEEELALCQRYYEKSHNCSFAPGTSGAHQVGNLYVAVLSAYEAPGTRFAVTKRTAPTITIYSPVDGASGKCYSGGANRDATAGYIGEASFGYITGSSYTTPLQYHWVADAEL